ncbi:MAG: HAMP domain-containing protein, partial [Bacteroidales bacterium]|nr:HAMP domain-containing protein [Bacteroidales bacterium]
MIIRSISIRSKLQLTTLVVVLLLTLLALIYMDATKKNSRATELLQERSILQSEYLSLNNTFQRIVLDSESNLTAALISQLHRFEEQLRTLVDQEVVSQMDQIDRKSGLIFSTLDLLAEDLRPSDTDSSGWFRARTDMKILGDLVIDFDRSVSVFQERSERNSNLQLGLSLVLGILLITTYLVFFALNLSGSFRKLSSFTRELHKGKLPPPLDFSSEDEFSQIAGNLNSLAADLQKKIGLITSLSEEGPGTIFNPDDEDELGNALLVLSDVLIRKELEEVTRNREDKRQNWISEGMAQMGEILRSERESVAELSYLVIQKLITYMNLEMGSLFITNNTDPENLSLDLIASYAYDRRKYLNKNLEWGVGLPGTCAQEKERIFLTAVPENYFEVSSGTGASIPNCLLLVPLKIDHVVYGVLELATMRLLRPFEIEFVESLCVSITSSLLAVRTSERTSELLKQSQSQSEELKSHEAAMQ